MSYTPPFEIVHKPSKLDNAWRRTFEPKVLQVVHVTGNARVAAYPEGFGSRESPGADYLYAGTNPASADGPSAHDYVGRKTGATIEMWNPATHVAWSNGDLKSPNLKLPGVKYLADLRARGINANKGCYREIELSGYPGSFDPTDAQIEVAAYFAARDSIATGLDIIRGVTMLTHGDINPIDRSNCAFRPAIREPRMRDIIDRALEIRALLREETVAGPEIKSIVPFRGLATIKNDGVQNAAIRMNDGKIIWLPEDASKEVIAKVQLAKPWPDHPSGIGYVVGDEPAILLAEDVAVIEAPILTVAEAADAIDRAIAADRLKARVTWQ